MPNPENSFLTLRPRSIWNDWNFNLLDREGRIVGSIDIPMWAQAKNARLRWQHPEDAIAAELNIGSQTGRIRFEYLSRGWTNVIRWTLESIDGDVLACLDQLRPETKLGGTARFLLTKPFPAELLAISGRWGNIRMDLKIAGGNQMPCVSTPKRFSIRRELRVENDALAPAIQAFIGFIALTYYCS